jgi:hypothetical protein
VPRVAFVPPPQAVMKQTNTNVKEKGCRLVKLSLRNM